MPNTKSLTSLLNNLKGGFSRRRRTRRGGSKLAATAAPIHHPGTLRKGGFGHRRGGMKGLRRGGAGDLGRR